MVRFNNVVVLNPHYIVMMHVLEYMTATIYSLNLRTLPSGSPVSSDVLPVSGTLQFVTNVRQQTIQLSVLPDELPEVTEVSTSN